MHIAINIGVINKISNILCVRVQKNICDCAVALLICLISRLPSFIQYTPLIFTLLAILVTRGENKNVSDGGPLVELIYMVSSVRYEVLCRIFLYFVNNVNCSFRNNSVGKTFLDMVDPSPPPPPPPNKKVLGRVTNLCTKI